MTKKDYELIAYVFKKHQGIANIEQANRMCKSIAGEMANDLQAENPLFNREKFLKACGVALTISNVKIEIE